MKKIISLITTLALAASLVACSTSTTTVVVPEVNADETKTADVIIVGAGAAGLASAIEAVENGATSVIILEKTSSTGGALNFTSGSMSGAETIMQEIDGIEDTKESFVQDILKNGEHKGNEELIRTFVDEDVDAMQWLWDNGLSDNNFGRSETMNVFAPEHALYSVQRTIKPSADNREKYKSAAHEILDTVVADISEITIEFNTTATQLVNNDKGQVLSVVATQDGKTIRYDANNGVIMATGGYSGNNKLMAAFTDNGANYLSGGSSAADGYGIYMMQEVGANIDAEVMSYVPTFPMGLDANVGVGKIAPTYTWKTGGICVNQEGLRFVDETEETVEIREVALEEQTNAIQYDIFTDAVIEDLIANNAATFWTYYYADGMPYSEFVVKAESLEELAEKLDIPYDALQETVDTYNSHVESGETDEFGRQYTEDSINLYNMAFNKIEGNSYYAVPLKALCVMTLGGVEINTDAQVLDGNGNPIAGLYAAGEVVGGIWGKFVSGGTGVMGPIVFGRIAGRNVMNKELSESYTLQASQKVIDPAVFEKEVVETTSKFDMTTALTDGEYEATVAGQEGEMVVKTVIADGKIASVEIVSSNETDSIAGPALEKIPAEIVANNDVNVDVVSGATLTSDRIMNAVADCLTQASK